MEINIKELDDVIIKMDSILKEVADLKKLKVPQKEWWNLREACKRKGICYQTVCNKRKFQPNRGKPDAKICGRKMWRNSTITVWLHLTDEDIEI